MVISEKRIGRRDKGVVWGVAASAAAVVFVSAYVGAKFWAGLLVAGLVVLLTALVLSIRVVLERTEDFVVIRCLPFYTAKIRNPEILAVLRGTETTLVQGFGVRHLGRATRGVLVGGPTVVLETAKLRWVISVTDPDQAISRIQPGGPDD